MRIVAGRFRGLKLDASLPDGVRPTSDRVRESLFNVLAHDPEHRTEAGPCPSGLAVLDVFAGTGALGLEALSRGAAQVGFIEQSPDALRLLSANINRARSTGDALVVAKDASHPGRSRQSYDLVLMDPPYRTGLATSALAGLLAGGWLADRVLIIVETDATEDVDVPPGLLVERSRRYGRTKLSFITRTA